MTAAEALLRDPATDTLTYEREARVIRSARRQLAAELATAPEGWVWAHDVQAFLEGVDAIAASTPVYPPCAVTYLITRSYALVMAANDWTSLVPPSLKDGQGAVFARSVTWQSTPMLHRLVDAWNTWAETAAPLKPGATPASGACESFAGSLDRAEPALISQVRAVLEGPTDGWDDVATRWRAQAVDDLYAVLVRSAAGAALPSTKRARRATAQRPARVDLDAVKWSLLAFTPGGDQRCPSGCSALAADVLDLMVCVPSTTPGEYLAVLPQQVAVDYAARLRRADMGRAAVVVANDVPAGTTAIVLALAVELHNGPASMKYDQAVI